MKAATIIVISIVLFFSVQEAQSMITAEDFWTKKINGNPPTTQKIMFQVLDKAFKDNNYEYITGEKAKDAVDLVYNAGTRENGMCEFSAFSEVAGDTDCNIGSFLQNLT